MKKLLLIIAFLVIPCIQGNVYIEDAEFILDEILTWHKKSIRSYDDALRQLSILIARCENGGKHTVNLNLSTRDENIDLDCSGVEIAMWHTLDRRRQQTEIEKKDFPIESAHRIEDSWRKILLQKDSQ